jgi:protein tyrosine/serine phosphatase
MKLFRSYATAVAVALCLTFTAVAGADQNGKFSNVKIENFGRISDNYYRGAQPKDSDYQDLAAFGIKTVINLTSDDADSAEQSMVEKAGMNYLQIPMNTHIPPTPEQIAQFFKVATDPASQPIYLHCVGGRHRTGVMTAAYRMLFDGWTANQAYKEMKNYKFGASFLHPEFKKFVYDYYTQVVASQIQLKRNIVAATAAQ